MVKGSSKRERGLKGGHAIVPSSPVHRQRYLDEHEDASCTSYGLYTPSEEDSTVPKGLKNVGNTCYANATLQCLLNTALTHALTDPKASAIFRRYSSNPNILAQGSGSVDSEEDCTTISGSVVTEHSSRRRQRERKKQEALEKKKQEEEAMMQRCQWLTGELRQITLEYHARTRVATTSWLYGNPPAPVVDPGSITRNPDKLSNSLTPYQQEDAHEFLRALLGTLVMHGQNKELSSLFDGLLESSVTCQTCFRPSLTRDRYMDLSLDIADSNIKTLTDALYDFTATETLKGENAVYCRNCECKRTATKGLRLATAPSILVCHMKRFAYDEFGRLVRLKKKVAFPVHLEIGNFMSNLNQARPPPYELIAVLVHQGVSCDSGHYLSYVKHAGSWYRTNDSEVTQVDLETVLSQQAYILMYEVAEMREKHGYSVKSPRSSSSMKLSSSQKLPASAADNSDSDDFFSAFASSLLCGMDYSSSIADMCHLGNWCRPQRPVPRRRKVRRRSNRHSRDDLSTLGESTVESSDNTRRGRFKRSSSSGNLARSGRQGNFKRSVSVASHHRRNHSNSDSKLPEYREAAKAEQARKWKTTTSTTQPAKEKRHGDLPPRRPQHRRSST